MFIKQGCALKNWVEGVSDEAFWESPKKNSTKIGQPYIWQRTKESFNSSLNGNFQVFQNHRKKEKINVVFHYFPTIDLNEAP